MYSAWKKLPIKVIVTETFHRSVRPLRKRYPHIMDDVFPLIEQIRVGETPGDREQGVGYVAYKVRLSNSDARRGKSGGYRAIYYLRRADLIFLVTIYSKSDRSDIPTDVLRRLIEEIEAQYPDSE